MKYSRAFGYEDICGSIYSVVFFGAPHRGLRTQEIKVLVEGQPTEELVGDLHPESTLLRSMNEAFPELSKNIKIISCVELKQTPTARGKPGSGKWERDGPPAMMVDRNSACLYTAAERIIAINQNHSMIAKLSSAQGSDYHRLKDLLAEDVRLAPSIVNARFARKDCGSVLEEISKTMGILILYLQVSKYRSHQASPPSDDDSTRTLIQASKFFEGFKDFVKDDVSAALLVRENVVHCHAVLILESVQYLRDMLLPYKNICQSYPNFAWQTAITFQSAEHSVLQVQDLFEEKDSRLVEAGRISDLCAATVRCITKIRRVISLALVGTDDISIEQVHVAASAQRSGIDRIALRQVLIRRSGQSESRPEALSGTLESCNSPDCLNIRMFTPSCERLQQCVLVEYRTYGNLSQGRSSNQKNGANFRHRDQLQRLTHVLTNLTTGGAGTSTSGSAVLDAPSLLKCIGYMDDSAKGGLSLLFEIPTLPLSKSINDIINLDQFIERSTANPKALNVPPLQGRFSLAKSVASAVLNLHSWGWIHKDIRSQNILLVPISQSSGTVSRISEQAKTLSFAAYLTGFEVARHANDISDATVTAEIERNLYRHPDRQNTPRVNFEKIHDLYAVGLILYEIGVFRTLKWKFSDKLKHFEKTGEYPDAEYIAARLRRYAADELPRAMGSRYAEAVRRCLEGDFGVEKDDTAQTELMMQFQELVLEVIEAGCRL